ncbi:MAG: hypothetical protein B1H03_01695 [Planctomycetales bacterium 4484_113]|nr:MAG: hypothetical protein B1H03_01695 [Planctomycetales bacterium 4484_113]
MKTSGTLFLIGTPIGNLGDITLRALDTLRKCELLFCEDTRVARKLLNHFNIHKPTRAFHRSSPSRILASIERELRAGKQVGYVANAGMPGLCDPGARLVAMCMEKGFSFDVVPGPSALVTALSAMPQEARQFSFFGFPPEHAGEQRKFLERIARLEHAAIIYVPPHATHVLFCRELTKLHQEIRYCTLSELIEGLPENVRGEITLVLMPPSRESETAELRPATLETITERWTRRWKHRSAYPFRTPRIQSRRQKRPRPLLRPPLRAWADERLSWCSSSGCSFWACSDSSSFAR